MKSLVSKEPLKRMALCIGFLSALPIAQAAQPITVTMTADNWRTRENAKFLRQLGFRLWLEATEQRRCGTERHHVQRRNDRVRRQYDRPRRTRNSLSSA